MMSDPKIEEIAREGAPASWLRYDELKRDGAPIPNDLCDLIAATLGTARAAYEVMARGDGEGPAVNVAWFSQELRELFRRHFVAWGDSTDWEKIARGALDSRSIRAALGSSGHEG
jgi:hypothetical protein